jgi:hypothetical protein
VLRREQQLVPVRRSFVSSIASGIDRIALSYIQHFELFGLAVVQLADSTQVNTLKVAFDSANDFLTRILADLNETHPTSQRSSVLQKAIEDAKRIATMIRDLYDIIYREATGLENTLTFAMPLFPVDVVANLHEIRQLLIDYRASLQDMLAVLGGINDARVIVRAKQSALDFARLIENVSVLAKSSAVENETELLKNASDFVRLDAQKHVQRTIAERLVSVFEEARQYDAQLNPARIKANL